MAIIPLSSEHVPAAADLVVVGVERLARRVPVLPGAWTDPDVVARVLAALVERGTGLAAIDDGTLVAFQAATVLDGHGGRWAYTPDLGHAAPGDVSGRLRERLYAGLADGWVGGACTEHVITILADDEDAAVTLGRLGFGQIVVDLVRDLAPVCAPDLPDGVMVRRALSRDAGAMVGLDAGLRRHLQATPVFLRLGIAATQEVQRRRIEDSAGAIFLAERDGEAVGFLRIGPSASDVATIVRDAGTASITGAFTVPSLRGGGVATALLAAAVDWAREAGFVRCAVDHESANREAGRFWSRHFVPVTVSLGRRLPPAAGT